MSIIKILPVSLINKIAAGEVIERPASIVKELVENAIDAKASKIDVYLEDGGRKLIRVTDDGIGMDAEDLALAFQSHTTSKLQNEDDLFAINTLGFRGEALPSIGAVSHACIISRLRGTASGAEIRIDGGAAGKVREKGAPEGTQVEVRGLFFNMPVRKKFLKAIPTEMAHIAEVLTRFALCYPSIHFTLTHNNRVVFNLPQVRDTAERIATFFGEEMRSHLIPVLHREELFTLTGFIVPPFFDKANARMMYIFLNGRYIKDNAIFRAINESYHGKLMHKRYPIVFLFLQVKPSEVDVNVHPTKIEVRFRNSSFIYSSVLTALKEGLNKSEVKPVNFKNPVSIPEGKVSGAAGLDYIRKSLWEQYSSGKDTDKIPASEIIKPEMEFTPLSASFDTGSSAPNFQHSELETLPGIGNQYREHGAYFQVHNTFIIEEINGGLNIIDQHALHEIILYHEIESSLQKAEKLSQRLLIPELVELGPKDFFCVISLKEYLELLGIELEEFGQQTIVIRSFPQILKNINIREFIESLLVELGDNEEYLKDKEKILNKLMSIMACKGAVKAGQKLELEEIKALLGKRNTMNLYTNNCPHGRPTTLFFSLDELQKQFKRK